MPTISMFYGILIKMYYDEHQPPHFHAYYNENKALFDFNGNLLEGKMPTKQAKLIQAWAIIHEEELKANWNLSRASETLFHIRPLE